MAGSSPHQASPHQAEYVNVHQQDDFLNLEHKRDRENYQESSVHTIHNMVFNMVHTIHKKAVYIPSTVKMIFNNLLLDNAWWRPSCTNQRLRPRTLPKSPYSNQELWLHRKEGQPRRLAMRI